MLLKTPRYQVILYRGVFSFRVLFQKIITPG